VLFLVFSFFISFVFSKNLFLSFWGKPTQADSLIVLLSCLVVFYCASWLKRRDVLKILEFFVTGSVILSILYLIQRFAGIKFSLFDNLTASAIVISIALTFLVSFVFNNLNYFRKGSGYNWVKVSSMGVFFVIFLASLFLIDFKLSWFFVEIGTFFIFWRSLMESGFKFRRKKAIFSLSLLFIFLFLFFLPNPWKINYVEPRLSYDSSWSVAEKSLRESAKNLFIGSGPSTYQYQFALYKDKAINLTDSSLLFNEGAIPLLTFLVTVGVLGTTLFLLLIFFFYRQGFKYFLDFKREKKDTTVNVRDILFPIVFSLSLLMFFYRIDTLSLFLLFFSLGLWDGQQKGEERVFEISDLPKNAMRVIFSLFFVFLSIIVFYFFNYYRAEFFYQKSVKNFKANGEIIESIGNMEKAVKLWKSSDYQIGLSQLYLLKASDDFGQKWTTEEKKKEQMNAVKESVLKAETVAKLACDKDKNNFQSWQNLGLVYENTNYWIEDRTEDALNAYAKAEKLAPQNYDIYIAIGRLLEKQGKAKDALDEYQKAFGLNPLDTDLIKKIDSLK
jgi:tetratricopeptide (TPR) repeat protein